jgi:cytidylate kinase
MSRGDLLENPMEECFLCEPEPWRVIYLGQHVQLLAGAGPLSDGYVILAPRDHVGTSAELLNGALKEFLLCSLLTIQALQYHFGTGYTSYEHARIGSCNTLATSGQHGAYCHHAHRVFIPLRSVVKDVVGSSFDTSVPLAEPGDIVGLRDKPYVFYESVDTRGHVCRVAYTGDHGLPSQYMRRLLVQELGLPIPWRWTDNLNYPSMIATVSGLRGYFVGYDHVDLRDLNLATRSLSRPVSLDGLSGVGKTTLASALARTTGRPMLDTGFYFRALAASRQSGKADLDARALCERVLFSDRFPELRESVSQASLQQVVTDAAVRSRFRIDIDALTREHYPAILTGRDAYSFLPETANRFLITASTGTRSLRRSLALARSGKTGWVKEPETSDTSTEDQTAAVKLPDAGAIRVIVNERRPFAATMAELVASIEGDTC